MARRNTQLPAAVPYVPPNPNEPRKPPWPDEAPADFQAFRLESRVGRLFTDQGNRPLPAKPFNCGKGVGSVGKK